MASQMNLPNALSLLRIFLVPVLVVVILEKFEGKEWVCVGIFLVAASTDWLDGWVARRRRQVTALGKLLDPMADKLLVSAVFISLVEEKIAPAWMVVVIIAREFAVTGLRGIAAERGMTIEASFWGKVKTTVQFACLVALLLMTRPVPDDPDAVELLVPSLGSALLWVTVLVTVASGVDYMVRFRRVFDMPERTA